MELLAFLGGLDVDKGAGGLPGSGTGCVAGPCGAGEGARAAQTMPVGAEPAAGLRSPSSFLSSVVRSSSFLPVPHPASSF